MSKLGKKQKSKSLIKLLQRVVIIVMLYLLCIGNHYKVKRDASRYGLYASDVMVSVRSRLDVGSLFETLDNERFLLPKDKWLKGTDEHSELIPTYDHVYSSESVKHLTDRVRLRYLLQVNIIIFIVFIFGLLLLFAKYIISKSSKQIGYHESESD